MKKNILSYGLSAIVLLSVLAMVMPVSAAVQMAGEFGVENAMGDSNTYVEVPVNITNTANGPISDIGFYLHYNENVLNLTNERIMRGGLASDWPFIIPVKEEEGVYFIGLRAKGIPAFGIPDGTSIGDGITGSVVLLNFSVVGGPGTSSYMNLSEVTMKNVSGELGTTALAKNGTFYVTGEVATTGDININEIMYHPPTDAWGGIYNEWIELYNTEDFPVNLSNWLLTGTITYDTTIPTGTLIESHGYLIIARNDTLFKSVYVDVPPEKVIDGSFVLGDDGDTIVLKNSTGVEIDNVTYIDDWGADGNGKTLELNATSDWEESRVDGGTPCQPNSVLAPLVDTTAPITNVTTPEMTEEPSPIPTGHELNWTNEDVNISFRRTDNDGGNPSGVNYTNLSAETQIINVNVNGTTMTIPLIGTGNLTINTTAFGETFNVTISDELNTKIYYYSVDTNDTANVEDTKNLTVRIDKTDPVINSVELNKTSVDALEPINVSVNVTDALSGVANVTAAAYATATPVELTKQNGNWWNGTITAAATVGTYNVTVTAYDNASNTDINNTVQYVVRVGAPSIIGCAPGSPVYNNEGATRTFNITIDQIANVTWLINGTQVEFNESVTEANYTNTSAVIGTWNVSAVVENVNGTTMQTWVWHVLSTGVSWFTIQLEPDYNLISVPLSDTTITDAQSLINKINAQGGNCTEVISWNGTAWLSYAPPDDPLNNVTIEGGEGYFVHVTVESDVTFIGTAWKN